METKGTVKHIVLVKFKEGTPADQIDNLVKKIADLVNIIEPLKAFRWGLNLNSSSKNPDEGYTHVLDLTFDTMEGVEEYTKHPAHLEVVEIFLPMKDKYIIVDYMP